TPSTPCERASGKGFPLAVVLALCGVAACRGPAPESHASATASAAPGPSAVVDVCVGEEFSCLLDDQGAVACFGDNGNGQSSVGGAPRYYTPHRVTGIPRARLLRCTRWGACVSSGRAVTCFGSHDAAPRVVQLPAVPRDFVAFGDSGCALFDDRSVS